MILPNLRIVLTAPQWLVVTMLACVIGAAVVHVVLHLYLANVKIETWDAMHDDAELAVRAVERHDAELDAIRDHLAATDTEPMRAVDVAGGLRAGRPTPYKRSAKGRHSA